MQGLAEKQELPDWAKLILEAGMKLEKPAPKEKKEPLVVSRAEVQAVKSDLQGLVAEGMELEEALEEAIQANLPVTMSEPTSPAELYAMYHSLEEVPDTTPYLMYSR